MSNTKRGHLGSVGAEIACGILFLASLAHALYWFWYVGFHHTVLDHHAFRQGQTALVAHQILQGGPLLAYELPVMGYPWSIPFEFPLYQWLAAGLAALAMPLDEAGRTVSIIFFLLSLWPINFILRAWHFNRGQRLGILSLILASPMYIFWSRTFMIESTALFFSVAYLALVVAWLQKPRPMVVVLGAATGILAALVKITTFVAFAGAAGLWVATYLFRSWPKTSLKVWLQTSLTAGVAFALAPLVAVQSWVIYSDNLKLQNPFAANFITSKALTFWNYGSLSQRLSGATWGVFWERIAYYIGDKTLLIMLVLGLMVANRRRHTILIPMALFFVPFLIFTNLHFVHDYYQYANAIFLIVAIGAAIAQASNTVKRQPLGAVLFAVALALMVGSYERTYKGAHLRDGREHDALGERIRQLVGPNDVVAIWGFDWAPIIPYVAKRRALMDRNNRSLDDPHMVEALQNLENHGYKVTALVFCDYARSAPHILGPWLGYFKDFKPVFKGDEFCDLYGKVIETAGTAKEALR